MRIDFAHRRTAVVLLGGSALVLRKCKMLVNGGLVVMAPGGGLHGYACGAIHASLVGYARRAGRGIALPDNVGFIVNLPHCHSFCPDAAFWTGGPLTPKFIEGAPIFAESPLGRERASVG